MTDREWLPRVTEDEYRTHQAAQWAVKTDTQLNDLAHDGWDFDSDAKLEALAPRLAPLPAPPAPAAGAGMPNSFDDGSGNTAPTPTDWVQRSEQQLASMGSFLPAGDVGDDPSTIGTPLPAMRQPTPAPAPAAAANPWGVTQGAATFGEQDDSRVGLPEPAAFGASLEAGTPEGDATLGRLSHIAAEQTPGGRLAQGYLGRVASGPPMSADQHPLENAASLAGLATVPFSIAGDALAAGAQGVLDRLPGGDSVPDWARERGITESTPVLGGLMQHDVAIPAALGMLTPGPDELRRGVEWAGSRADDVAAAAGRRVDEAGGIVPFLERGELRLPGGADDAATSPVSRPPFRLSEAGRTERDSLIEANVALGIPEDAAAGQVDTYIKALDDVGQVPAPYIASREMFRRLATGQGTRAQAAELGKRGGEFANRVRYSGMLSNPAGAIVDIVSNGLNVPLTYNRVVQAALMEGLGERLGKIKPKERSAVLAELDGLNQGLIAGTVDGMRDALAVMLKGGRPVRAEQPRGLVEGPAGLVAEFGQRMRIAADVLFSEVGERMAANSLGIREASREGLKYGTDTFRNRAAVLSEGIRTRLAAGELEQGGVLPTMGKTDAQKVEQLAAEALAMSKRGIFQSELGATAKAIEDARGTPVTRFAVPFYRTMANVAAQGVGMTPGASQLGIAGDLFATGAFGKGAYATGGNMLTTTNTAAVLPATHRAADANLGLLVAATGGALVASGLMTGAPPKDQTLRRAWYDAGHRPFSLKVDGQEVPVMRLVGPLALPLAFGASLMDEYRANGYEVDPAMLQEFAGNVQGEWFNLAGLRAFDDLLGAARGGRIKGELTRFAARQAGSFVPNSALARAIANANDTKQRAPQVFLDFIKEGVPGLRQQVPVKQNATLKQDVDKPESQRGAMAFSPIQPVPAADDATNLDREIALAKRDAVRTLEAGAAYRRMTPDAQKRARTSALARISSRFTAQRRALAGELLGD